MISVALPHVVGVQLAHAMVRYVADQNGVRVLFMKGLTAQKQGLRASALVPADVDVIVDPSRFMVFIDAMQRCGWRARYDSPEAPRLLGMHSVTLIHPDWPCDIDVHYFLPGFFRPPQQVFDQLWSQHEEIALAGKPVPVPARADHLAILGVNALRAPRQARYVTELNHLAALLRADDDLRRRWEMALVRLGVRSVSGPLVDRLGDVPVDVLSASDLTPSDVLLWQVYVASEDPDEVGALRYWGGIFHSTNGRKRWRSFLRVLWKPREELERTLPEIRTWNAWVAFKLQVQRWRRGIRGLGELVRARNARAALRMVEGPRQDLAIPDLDDTQMVSGEELRAMIDGIQVSQQGDDNSFETVSEFTEKSLDKIRVCETSLGSVVAGLQDLGSDSDRGRGVPEGQDVYVLCSPRYEHPSQVAEVRVLRVAGSGALIWSQVVRADHQSVAQIVAALSERLGVDSKTIIQDVLATITTLKGAGAVSVKSTQC